MCVNPRGTPERRVCSPLEGVGVTHGVKSVTGHKATLTFLRAEVRAAGDTLKCQSVGRPLETVSRDEGERCAGWPQDLRTNKRTSPICVFEVLILNC